MCMPLTGDLVSPNMDAFHVRLLSFLLTCLLLGLQWRDNWEYLQVTGDYQRVLYHTLEGVLELAGRFSSQDEWYLSNCMI